VEQPGTTEISYKGKMAGDERYLFDKYNSYKPYELIMAEKKTVINFTIEQDLLDQVEDFHQKWKFLNRAKAIKWLLRWSLSQNPNVPEKDTK
jgi:hypothetical protein